MLKKLTGAILFIIVLSLPSPAAPSMELPRLRSGQVGTSRATGWQEILLRLNEFNYDLKSAQKQLDASRVSFQRAYGPFLPQLSASLSFSDTLPATSQNYSWGLSVTQSLFKGFSNYYALQSARTNYQYYEVSLNSTAADVYYRARLAFIDLFIAAESLKLEGIILARREENTRLVELRYQSGREDRGNLMRTGADQAEAKYNLAAARRDQQLARLKFVPLLGQAVDEVTVPEDGKIPEAVDFSRLAEASPAYLMAGYQLETAAIAQKSSISGLLPTVSLGGSYRRTGSDWPPSSDSSALSLSVAYPFFPGGTNLADRAIAEAQLAKASEDFALRQKEIRYNLEEAYLNFKDTLEAREFRKTFLAAVAERAKIGRAKYMNGLITYDEWYRIENEYISAQKSLLAAQKSALAAEAAWHKSYGGWVK